MSLDVAITAQLAEFPLQVRFTAPASGVTALFGPSGAGKTCTLRAIAGLDRHRGSQVRFAGETWQDQAHWLPTWQRPLSYLFQESSLFAHLNVLDNVRYGLRRRGGTQAHDPMELLERLGLAPLAQRQPQSLSGGERRRVALARALAPAPRLLLMDEPLSGLDRARKAEILPWLAQLSKRFATPMLLVSHELQEVARLADRLVLMDRGRVHHEGGLIATLARADLALADRDDASVVLEGKVNRIQEAAALAEVSVGQQQLRVLLPPGLEQGQTLRLQIAARDVSLATCEPRGSSILNILPARVSALREAGAGQTLVALELDGGGALLSRITRWSCEELGLQPDMPVFAQVKSVALLT